MTNNLPSVLLKFGFKFDKGGAHLARTMMLDELRIVLSYVKTTNPTKKDFVSAIEIDNCLGKRSGKSRILSARHLVNLYSLDPSVPIFRVLLYFWMRDTEGQQLLALQCAYCRDAILRMSTPIILNLPEGTVISRQEVEAFIDKNLPDRFSEATLKSTAQNINGTWTNAGHLVGKAKKVRSRAIPTPGSVAFALYLGFISGFRGQELLSTEYMKNLDCTSDKAIELADIASRRGWIVFKRVGNVMEVQFPNLITPQERELLYGQN